MKFGSFFGPMLLKEIEKPFNSKDFLYEIKFDGIRATIHVGPKKFCIFSRRGINITSLYPELKKIQSCIKENMIFDGEIVLFDNGMPSFSKLQERNRLRNAKKIAAASLNSPVCFMAFDCLYKNKDITSMPLIDRKKILETITDNDFFIKTKYIVKSGIQLFKKVKEKGLEGIVAKRIDSKYQINTRSEDWIKIKNLKQEFFYIGGYKDNLQNAIITLYLGEYLKNEFHFVGKVIAGKKKIIYKKLLKEPKTKKSFFFDFEKEDINYVKPKLKCKICYLERTKNNHLRQPVFKE